jgi:myo-inositol-1(or 4)-monophosphatase
MESVSFAYVCDLSREHDWWAARGEGAYFADRLLPALPDDGKLELLGLESTTPRNVAIAGKQLEATQARRLRVVGSIALALCYVATGWLDGLVTLAPARSVDAAAGQLVVREVGGCVAFVDAQRPLSAALDLGMRSRLAAAKDPGLLDVVAGVIQNAP